MPIVSLDFYAPWPNFGKKLSGQWDALRADTRALAPLVRASQVDLDESNLPSSELASNLSAWALGELGFRNRFRLFYDWLDCLRIRQSDHRVIAAGAGGFESINGFYNVIFTEANLAVTRDFANAVEWEMAHNLNISPVLAQAYAETGTLLAPTRIDTSDPNTAFFYFPAAQSGTAIVSGASNSTGVRVKDTIATGGFNRKTDQITFDHTYFYLSSGGNNPVIVSFKPGSVGGGPGGGEVNTGANLGTGEGVFAQKFGTELQFKSLIGGSNVTLSSDSNEITIDATGGGGAGTGFYGITAKHQDDSAVFSGLNVLAFDEEFFYLTQNAPNTDEVQINLRNLPGAGGGETNTGANVGSGQGNVFRDKTGTTLNFKTLLQGSNITITDNANDVTIASTAGGGGGGGFYGVVFRESEAGGAVYKTDTLTFDSDHFYLSTGGDGHPIVSGFVQKAVHSQGTAAVEWQFTHNLGTPFITWSTYDPGFEAIIPGRVDVSDPNTAYFYFPTTVAGTAVLIG
jgi:hypothetical protein